MSESLGIRLLGFMATLISLGAFFATRSTGMTGLELVAGLGIAGGVGVSLYGWRLARDERLARAIEAGIRAARD